MRFLVDAQLPRRLVAQLTQAGLEAIHTLDLLNGNRTSDREIAELSIKERYIVITKDSDFVEIFLLRGVPWKLLLVSTGNIDNLGLEALFSATIPRIVKAFDVFDFIEMGHTSLIFHM